MTVKIGELIFDKDGLIPAIVSDVNTGKVLTLAYMNKESLEISIERRLTCFWSRSRQELWLKGESSGNYQHIESITADCDRDALLIKVKADGPACHLGTESCFEYPVLEGTKAADDESEFSYEALMAMMAERKEALKEGSYTSYLFEKGLDKILKKIGEESTEVVIAAKANDRKETVYEIADLAYHVMVLMTEAGITLDDISGELASRRIIDKKIKQEKMV